MKRTLKIGLLGCLTASLALFATGCLSYGGSYEKHYHNDLSNGGQQANCGTSGTVTPVVNGGETYEHHYSYDLNPLCWIGQALGGAHTDNEVVVTPCYRPVSVGVPAPQPSCPQAVGYAPQPEVKPNYSVLGYDSAGLAVYISPGYPGWFWYGNRWQRSCPILSGHPIENWSRSSYYGEVGGSYRNYQQPQYRQEVGMSYGGVRYNRDSGVRYMGYGGGR